MVKDFELHVGGLGINPPHWLPLLHASLYAPPRSNVMININEFTLDTIYEMQGSAQGFSREVFLVEKKYKPLNTKYAIFHMYIVCKGEYKKMA